MTTTATLPAKGTVWRHARRKDYTGAPLELTVTSITAGKVYSRTTHGTRVKTPVDLFDGLCLEIVSVPEPAPRSTAPRLTTAQCRDLIAKAHAAGMAAGEAATPTPMVVYQREHPLDDTSRITKVYAPVMSGVCGFAWVTIRPGTSSLARYVRTLRNGGTSYYGGTDYRVHAFGQSYERKMAYARAFAAVLEEAGFNAYAGGRLD